jgi:hypothetical protein
MRRIAGYSPLDQRINGDILQELNIYPVEKELTQDMKRNG